MSIEIKHLLEKGKIKMLMNNRKFSLLLVAAFMLLLWARPVGLTRAQDAPLSVLASEHDPSVDIKWMQLLYDRVEADKISAPAASRLYAYAGITAYQSVLPGIPEGISLSGQLSDMPDMPQIDQDAV